MAFLILATGGLLATDQAVRDHVFRSDTENPTVLPAVLTPEVLAPYGIVYVHPASPPAVLPWEAAVPGTPAIPEGKNYYQETWQIVQLENLDSVLEDVVSKLRATIDTERAAREHSNVPYLFSDGLEGSIQFDAPRHRDNLRDLFSVAANYRADGVTEAPMALRDHENVTHQMTNQDMLQIQRFLASRISGIYEASWDKKHYIDQILEDNALTTQEQLHLLYQFDVTVDWPV